MWGSIDHEPIEFEYIALCLVSRLPVVSPSISDFLSKRISLGIKGITQLYRVSHSTLQINVVALFHLFPVSKACHCGCLLLSVINMSHWVSLRMCDWWSHSIRPDLGWPEYVFNSWFTTPIAIDMSCITGRVIHWLVDLDLTLYSLIA